MILIILAVIIFIVAASKKKKPKECYNPVSYADIARQQKEREKAIKEAGRIERLRQREKEKQIKLEFEKAQAAEDIPYLKNQIERYFEMITDCKTDLKLARQRVEYDNDMNKYGAVIPEKEVNKHMSERDKLLTKLIKLENQIHAAEKKLNKAEQILNRV